MRPARSSTLRCLEIVGWLSANGFMISDTSASPDARRARIARRVGSASAEKVNPRGSNCASIAMWLYCHMAIYVSSEESSSEARGTREKPGKSCIPVCKKRKPQELDASATRAKEHV